MVIECPFLRVPGSWLDGIRGRSILERGYMGLEVCWGGFVGWGEMV